MAKVITNNWLKRKNACGYARKMFRKTYPSGVTINKRSLVKFSRLCGIGSIHWLLDRLESEFYNKQNFGPHAYINNVCSACEARRKFKIKMPQNTIDRIMFFAKKLKLA